MNLDTLQKDELQNLLRDLKLYRNLMRQLGNRWKEVFAEKFYGKEKYEVEYFEKLDEKYVLSQTQEILKNVFQKDISAKEIVLKKNSELLWGMKIYYNDNLIDLSFLKMYKLLK